MICLGGSLATLGLVLALMGLVHEPETETIAPSDILSTLSAALPDETPPLQPFDDSSTKSLVWGCDPAERQYSYSCSWRYVNQTSTVLQPATLTEALTKETIQSIWAKHNKTQGLRSEEKTKTSSTRVIAVSAQVRLFPPSFLLQMQG